MNKSGFCLFDGQALTPLLPLLLILETGVGIVGNGVALWIFCFYLKPWKTSTVLLVNLALADFMLLLALPFRISYYLRHKDWIFGDAFCRINLFMLALNRTGSIFFLTVIALDRYFKVVHPHSRINSLSVRQVICTACGMWTLAIGLASMILTESHLFPNQTQDALTQCDSFAISMYSASVSYWYYVLFLVEFFVPLLVTLFCAMAVITRLHKRDLDKQTRIKRALVCLCVVVVVFVVCFLPSKVTRIAIWVTRASHEADCEGLRNLDNAFYFTVSITYLNSVLDPLVYFYSSPTFRRASRKMVSYIRKKRRASVCEKPRDSGFEETSNSHSVEML
ncbi:hydroxycarboxylic acid receptor 2-like [Erpetoichthys calabaricus]|uniref:hydroxycarboxylic acid receptor 2-like n=1 Tax=Erpetoichthys calabaricus TaxID=27687 RepID=UPI0010A01658|nr:hydroxycarboxylic acid receptor 2-like [Erpetoichthys calabaricus]